MRDNLSKVTIVKKTTAPAVADAVAPKKTVPIKGLMADTSEGDNLAKASIVKSRCGDCMHYRGTAHPTKGSPCINLGVTTGAIAPACYTPDLSRFRTLSNESFKQLVGIVTSFTPQQHRIMMGLFRSAASLERLGLHFMQTVYFSLGTGETLDSYYRGYVLSVGPNKSVNVVGTSYIERSTTCLTASLSKSSLMTWSQFKKRKEKLIGRGALEELPPRRRSTYTKDDYEPPTLDTAVEHLKSGAEKGKGKSGKVKSYRIEQESFDNSAD